MMHPAQMKENGVMEGERSASVETEKPMPTVAQAFVDQLAAWGVERVYGVPGDAILPLISALADRGTPRFIPTRQEQSAAFMAKVDAQLTGKIGVCIATSGPGAVNMANGIADAQKDSAPVVAITGQVDSRHIGSQYRQEFDQQQFFQSIAELSVQPAHPAAVNDGLTRVIRTAVARRKATHISIPHDFWQATVVRHTDSIVKPEEPYLHTPARSHGALIEGAAHLLHEVQRPAILVGIGARDAMGQVLKLAEKIKAPIFSTLAALGRIPGNHYLNMGSVGEGGSAQAMEVMTEADLILRLGTTWWPSNDVLPARTLDMNVKPEHVGMQPPTAYGLVGPLQETLPPLIDMAPDRPRPEWETTVAHARETWYRALHREVEEGSGHGFGIHPGLLAHALTRQLPHDAVVSLDVGDHFLWFNRHFQGSGYQDVVMSGNWRTMGFGLPAALGAKMARPDRPVVAVVGDGGFSMGLSEWMTAIRYGLPVTVVIFNNRSLAMEEHEMERKGMHVTGVALHNPNFARFATICGGCGFPIESPDQLDRVLHDALHSGGPAIVDASVLNVPFPVFEPAAADPSIDRMESRI